MECITPPSSVTSESAALLHTQQLGMEDNFGDCEDAGDTRPWRILTDFSVYSPRTKTLRPIQEVMEGAELLFCGTITPFEDGLGPKERNVSWCAVRDIGPILERSFQGYGEKQLSIWISTARAHYAIRDPAEEYR